MQSFPEIDAKFQERHKVIFGVVETKPGEISRAMFFPDAGILIAGMALRTWTVVEAMQFCETFHKPRVVR